MGNMHALIDADRLAYAFGGFVDDDGQPLAWPLVAERVDTNIRNIMSGCGADTGELFLTGDDGSNFRIHVATIRPYKGHRSTEKPFWYEQIRRYLIDEYGARVSVGMEADDVIGIEQCQGSIKYRNGWFDTIICSVDKDLNNIPGFHYNELKQEKYWVSELDSLRNFYSQLLTGDPTDNIPGLFGVGSKARCVDDISKSADELTMYSICRREYEKRFGSYWEHFLVENGTLLWILREEDVNSFQTRMYDLEEKRMWQDYEAGLKTESVNN